MPLSFRRRWWLFAVLIAGAAAGVWTCGRAALSRQNLLLITLDTTRADRLGACGVTEGLHIVVEAAAFKDLLRPIDRRDGFCATADPTLWGMVQAMRETNAVFGGGDSGRYWFRETFPTCDAVLTLSKLLQALSRSDAEFSIVLAGL